MRKENIFGLFTLVMITVGAVDSIRNLPTAALFGSSLVFFFLFGAMIFLLPSAFIAAELVSAWPECGGVYVWVKQAFGQKVGFLAIWLQWIENVIWFPTILSFIAGSVGYLISPDLAESKIFIVLMVLAAFWFATIINLLGMRSSAIVGVICTALGLLFPVMLIVILGIKWIVAGHATQVNFSDLTNFRINFSHPQMWIALTGIMLSYCGLEITTVHAHEVHKPHHNFPRALIISVVLLLTTLILGSLSIAVVLPGTKINLISGIMQTFDTFFSAYHLHWLMPIMGLSLVLGGIGGVSSWIIAPTRGLLIAAHDGRLPKHCRKQNRYGAPSTLLLYQAGIVSVIIMIFLFMPSVSGSYWLLTVLAAQLYMLMYLLMFSAAIYLRYKKPDYPRPFHIPGGKLGMWLVGGLGIIGAGLTFCIGFIPPHEINTGGVWHFEIMLISGLILASIVPFLESKKFKRDLPQIESEINKAPLPYRDTEHNLKDIEN